MYFYYLLFGVEVVARQATIALVCGSPVAWSGSPGLPLMSSPEHTKTNAWISALKVHLYTTIKYL